MKDRYSQEQLDEMRKRLYDRSASDAQIERHQLTDTKVDVSRDWAVRESAPNTTDLRAGTTTELAPEPEVVAEESKPKRHYRRFILIGSVLIFVFVAGLSSLFLFLGGNQISGDNIEMTFDAPSTIGGGEEFKMEIGILNQNSVPIESTTLILKYPEGALSTGEPQRTLYEERIPLEDIAAGESMSVPVAILVFGEENAQKEIKATLEYRVTGSNGMFYKDIEPHPFRISSSPLVLSVKNLEKVASGQMVEVTVTAVSNGSNPLRNLLVSASYPNGFDFQRSTPEPVYGENVWRIEELLPNKSQSIKIIGLVTGQTEESFRINFSAGPADTQEQFVISAPLADSRADFTVERPFIDVDVAINGQETGTAVIEQDVQAGVTVDITNTLDETVYDMVVEVVPTGNALDERSIAGQNGFYDSNTGSVRWEVANNPLFAEINPGDSRQLNFTITQGKTKTTSSFDMVVNVYARRVAESNAVEQLIGTVSAQGKYSSVVTLGSQTGRKDSRFGDVGPVPPKVGETTTYTMSIVAQAGANDLVDGVVETSLPVYVNWLDAYEADGTVTYNTVSKKLQWVIGDVTMGERKEFVFQVSLQPSISQLGDDPVLLNRQTIRANDRFTGALLQEIAKPVTTELSTEFGFEEKNGDVVR